jgi:NAD(P)-dependent dehydrogenase (short-subunit alcohol dehydrogenase family)
VPGTRYDVSGRVALVTGGARGIGADAARRLAGRGARVALLDLDPLVERTAAEIGGDAAALVADVTDADALESAVADTVERFGGIDVTIAAAGIAGVGAPVDSIDPADFERVTEINLMGVWRTVRATLPHVIERRGYVLPIASIAAALPVPLLTAYGVSKAGVEAFARGLRMELAHTGTKVGVAYFGLIDTELVRGVTAQPAIARTLEPQPVGNTPAPYWFPAWGTAAGRRSSCSSSSWGSRRSVPRSPSRG